MGDASGMYASPTGTGPQNGGAGQRQGNEQSLHNESFSLEVGEQSSGQASGRRTSIGTMAMCELTGFGVPVLHGLNFLLHGVALPLLRARKKRCVSRHADSARLAGMLRMGGSVRG